MNIFAKISIALALIVLVAYGDAVFAASSMYQRCDPGISCQIGEYVFANDGHTPVNTDNYCQVTITDPGDAAVVSAANMNHKADGWYYYSLTISSPLGLYRGLMCCDSGDRKRCTDKTFILGSSLDEISAKSDQIESNTELLRDSTFDFSGIATGGSASTLVDTDLNQSDNYWVDYQLVMISGNNSGQRRMVSAFSKSSHTLTVSASFANPIAAGDHYIISHEPKVAQTIWNWTSRQLTSAVNVAGDIAQAVWTYGDKTLTSLGSLAADIWNVSSGSLATSGTIGNQLAANLDATVSSRASQTSADAIRASQQKQWNLYLSGSPDVATGNTYRAKLWILNYESTPTDAITVPTVTLYDAGRNKVAENVELTKISSGIYEYTYNVIPTAIQGNWETQVSATVESGKTISASDYWKVTGSPAQVRINAMNSVSVPNISASATITNEGSVGYEYHYEWCVVSSQNNACGGNDDVFYSSAAKFIQPDENWITDLPATVSSAGDYWFKATVYYGTEQSVASLGFTATNPSSGGNGSGGGSNVSSGGSSPANQIKDIAGQIKGAFCSVFPCEVINRMLIRLNSTETSVTALTKRMDLMNLQMASLLKAAPPQVIVQKRVYTVQPAAPQKTSAKLRARIGLDLN